MTGCNCNPYLWISSLLSSLQGWQAAEYTENWREALRRTFLFNYFIPSLTWTNNKMYKNLSFLTLEDPTGNNNRLIVRDCRKYLSIYYCNVPRTDPFLWNCSHAASHVPCQLQYYPNPSQGLHIEGLCKQRQSSVFI